MRRLCLVTSALVLTLTAGSSWAGTPNTRSLEPGATRPAATLADAAWLPGRWVGSGVGADAEEIWSPALGGAMMGVFRSVKDGRVSFYEILTLVEVDGTLALRLKHFDALLHAWEEKAEVREFRLVKKEPGALWFDSISLRREGDTLKCWVAVKHEDGKVEEIAFEMRREGL